MTALREKLAPLAPYAQIFAWWISRYELLLLGSVGVALIALGVGDNAGLPSLLFTDSRLESLFAGAFLTLYVADNAYIAFLLRLREFGDKRPDNLRRFAMRFGVASLGPFALAFTIGGIRAESVSFVVGVVIACAIVISIAHITFGPTKKRLTRLHNFYRDQLETGDDDDGPKFFVLQAVLGFIVISLIIVAHLVAISIGERYLFPATVAAILLGTVSALYGFARFWTRTFYPILVVVALVCLAFFVALVSIARYSELPAVDYAEPAPLPALLDDAAVVEARCEDKPVIVLVAVSGGGIRAATWSAVVLEELAREIPAFEKRVRMISGASGGMVGASAWVANLHEKKLDRVADHVSRDALAAVARGMILVIGDRGQALERSFETNTDDVMALPLKALREKEAAGEIPSLVFTPMIVDDGRRMFISNLDLRELATSTVGNDRLSLNAVQFSELFADYPLKMSTAARMSASFPYVSPATELPTTPPVRVVDAGYYDNYGAGILTQWILARRETLNRCTSGVALVQIRDKLGKRQALDARKRSVLERGFSWISSPIEAVLYARDSSQAFRNDERIEIANAALEVPFLVETFSLNQEAPLNWRLRDADYARIRDSLGDTREQIARVKAFVK